MREVAQLRARLLAVALQRQPQPFMGARGAGREALFATRGEGLCTRVKRGWGEPSGAVSRPAPRGQEGPLHSSQQALFTVAKHPSALRTTPLGAVRTLAL